MPNEEIRQSLTGESTSPKVQFCFFTNKNKSLMMRDSASMMANLIEKGHKIISVLTMTETISETCLNRAANPLSISDSYSTGIKTFPLFTIIIFYQAN